MIDEDFGAYQFSQNWSNLTGIAYRLRETYEREQWGQTIYTLPPNGLMNLPPEYRLLLIEHQVRRLHCVVHNLMLELERRRTVVPGSLESP